MPVSAGMTAVPEANPVAQESVITTTLNSYAEQSGVARFALVKIDAEGHDLVVLRGAWSSIPDGMRTLKRSWKAATWPATRKQPRNCPQ